MPIYEYECPKCGCFTAIQKVGDDPLVAKPDCHEVDCPKQAKKLISAAAFHLKGSGWYKTDYASSSGPGGAASAGDTSASGGGDQSSRDQGSRDQEQAALTDSKTTATDKGSDGGGSGGSSSGGCGTGCGCH